MIDISVLLTIRNWDLTRVEMCLGSIHRSDDASFEIVVVDYGSDDAKGIATLAARYDCTLVRVEADEWSRSNAMNAAAGAANGRNFIFADADLVFAPSVLAETVRELDRDPNTVLLFQFRDLPPGIEPASLIREPDFRFLESTAVWRPRWGMGVQAYSRQVFELARGFDERMKVYGGEDNDIAKRARRLGHRVRWVNEERFGLYHVWHPSSREAADANPETKAELAKNVDIAKNDRSLIRNFNSSFGNRPLVSIVISTHNRAEYIEESINSVIGQSVQDFEILVLDDGSTDNTREVVEAIPDRRLRYYYFEKTNIPSLRNAALELASGIYTAIHDDDDIMLPWSLESRLKAIEAGDNGSYGAAINFSNATGALDVFPGRDASLDTVLNGAKVFYHATLLIETDALRAVRYEEAFNSGSDYNLALRLMKVGIRLRHCEEVVLLRRLHDRQVTVKDQVVQHGASYVSTFAQRIAWSGGARRKSREIAKGIHQHDLAEGAKNSSRFYRYLPDHLVSRSVLVPLDALSSVELPQYDLTGSIEVYGASSDWGIYFNAPSSVYEVLCDEVNEEEFVSIVSPRSCQLQTWSIVRNLVIALTGEPDIIISGEIDNPASFRALIRDGLDPGEDLALRLSSANDDILELRPSPISDKGGELLDAWLQGQS